MYVKLLKQLENAKEHSKSSVSGGGIRTVNIIDINNRLVYAKISKNFTF